MRTHTCVHAHTSTDQTPPPCLTLLSPDKNKHVPAAGPLHLQRQCLKQAFLCQPCGLSPPTSSPLPQSSSSTTHMKEHELFARRRLPTSVSFPTYRTPVSWRVSNVPHPCTISTRAWASSALCFIVSLAPEQRRHIVGLSVNMYKLMASQPHASPLLLFSVLCALQFLALEQQSPPAPAPLRSSLPDKNR